VSRLVTAEISWPVDETGALCVPGTALAGVVLARIEALDAEVVAEAAGSYYDVVIDELLGGVRELFDGTAVVLDGVLADRGDLIRVIHAGDREIVMSCAFHAEDGPDADIDSPLAMAVGFVDELGVVRDPITL
jgi:hypothetical protein